jgi:hypothetical protein
MPKRCTASDLVQAQFGADLSRASRADDGPPAAPYQGVGAGSDERDSSNAA